ncbi:Gfa-like protein, partial [Mycena leptocephala]
CNCSICARDGALWIYPTTTAVTLKELDSLGEYTFGRKLVCHKFCTVCGVAIGGILVAGRTTALNVRTMNGLDLSALEITKWDGKASLPAYKV